MSQPNQITFYTHAVRHSASLSLSGANLTTLLQYSPYSHRVHIALEEAKADYTLHTIDRWNKPAWYVSDVNPVGKVSPCCIHLQYPTSLTLSLS